MREREREEREADGQTDRWGTCTRPDVSAGPPGARLLTTRTSDEFRRDSLNTIPTPAGALSDPGGRTDPARDPAPACRAARIMRAA